jgi:Tfp pilus assembly protein PilN
MTTLELPPRPAPASQPGPMPPSARFVTVFADLMPDEVLAARSGALMKRRMLIALAGVVVFLTAIYGFSWMQTHNAEGDLGTAQDQATALMHRQQEFTPLVKAQADSSQIEGTLARVMVGDLKWSSLLESVRAQASPGMVLTNITGTVTVASAAAAPVPGAVPPDVLNQSGQAQVGTLTISGTARDKNSVAAFVDRLGHVKGLAGAFPTSVTKATGTLTFAVNVVLTTKALGGRFAPVAGIPGGK